MIQRKITVYYTLDLIFIVLATVTVGYGNTVLTKVNNEIWENGDNGEYNCEYNDITTDGNDGQNYEKKRGEGQRGKWVSRN